MSGAVLMVRALWWKVGFRTWRNRTVGVTHLNGGSSACLYGIN